MSDISSLFPKVAIVADQMTAFGGADREMYSMLKVLPHVDIFTIIFNKEKYPTLKNKVYTTFVQKLSKFLPKGFYRHLKVLTPIAYESIDLEGYDLVISISAGPAKGVITSLDQPHLAMVMTPPRSLWDKELNVRGSKLKSLYKGLSNILNTYMRVWDYSISKRVDYWSANSNFIKRKIKKTYQQDAEVIYPGVEKKYFAKVSKERIEKIKERYSLPEKFFLVVSRLYDYKRVDLAINASIKAKKQLYIIGEGPDKKYLEKIAGENNNIHFLGFLPSDDDVIVFYKLAEALLFCGIEDFGLTPVEAMASGTPVIAYEYGGVLETVKENITGQFFSNEDELTTILKDFDKTRYNQDKIIKQAKTFSEEEFIINFTKYLKYIYEQENAKKNA
ncbi:MAG: glycosyltransferase [Candidatus Dojkabacteria bacterium]|jgi:glycosyltransferase involved in cell wall biosynthesis